MSQVFLLICFIVFFTYIKKPNYYQNNEKIQQKKKDSEIYQSPYKEEKQKKR